MSSNSDHRNTFVLRIWREGAEHGREQRLWRGWVQHSRSGEASYVKDLEGLLAFLERWAGELKSESKNPNQGMVHLSGRSTLPF